MEVAAAFREPEDGSRAWRVSFRSRGNVDVSAIAQRFGGGGHKNAAGCAIEGDQSAVRERIAAEVAQAVEQIHA